MSFDNTWGFLPDRYVSRPIYYIAQDRMTMKGQLNCYSAEVLTKSNCQAWGHNMEHHEQSNICYNDDFYCFTLFC